MRLSGSDRRVGISFGRLQENNCGEVGIVYDTRTNASKGMMGVHSTFDVGDEEYRYG